ncbi:MAG: TlpA disulfide reductase family protein [Polyangiaceae bacterium]
MLRRGRAQNYAYTLRHVACAGIALVFASGCAAKIKAPPSAPSPLLAQAVPDFSRPALDGSRIETAALRGRVVVLDFFAEHCVPCAKSLPAIEAMHRSDAAIAVVGVSEDDDEGGARRMVARHGLTFPVIHDPSHTLAGRYRVNELPATFVVDPRGVVRWRGAMDEPKQMQAVVDEAR